MPRAKGSGEKEVVVGDHRNVSVEVLRDFYLDLVELSSLTLVAARAGLPRTSLTSFLAGARPHRRTHRRLALYFLAASETGPREEALAVLTDGDDGLKRVLLRAAADYHQSRGHPVPTWAEVLLRDR